MESYNNKNERDNLDIKLKKSINNNLISDTNTNEYLLNPENNRLTIYPIKNEEIWKSYKKQQAAFWTAEEIDFSKDYDHFIKLTPNEQHFIKMILAFFSSSDTIVNINLAERFLNDVKIREANTAYTYQMMMENIHCVSEDTKILTDKGYFEIGKLENKNVNVWNGKEFTTTTIKFTGNSKLYNVILDNGLELKCTPNHKWYIHNENQQHSELSKKEIVYTKDLNVGNVIYKYELPILNCKNPDEFLNPYIHGFFCGYDNKKDLIQHFDIQESLIHKSENYLKFDITNKINKEKYYVPYNYDLETKITWLEGLCDSIGYVKKINSYSSILIFNTNLPFLRDVQLLLSTLGLNTDISLSSQEQHTLIPNCENKENLCKVWYTLYLCPSSVTKLINLNFKPKKLEIDKNNELLNTSDKIIKIKEIQMLEGIHKTFCFTEEKEHSGIFNGILTGQSETYSLQIDNLIRDPEEKNKLFNAIKEFPCIAEKAAWSVKWIESNDSFAKRVVAFAIVEGIFFSGAFCSIFWLKKRNIMPGLCTSNELISRDEGLHCDFAVLMYSMTINKLSESDIHAMIQDAVEVERKFICESLPCGLLGMNSDLMNQYIKYVADRLLVMLGYNKFFNVINPFDFMESISIEGKPNFFEHRPTQYQKAAVLNKTRDLIFNFTEDF